MSHQELDTRSLHVMSLRFIKRQARILSRTRGKKSYMQYLDQVANERFGVRHYHEAQTRVKRNGSASFRAGRTSPSGSVTAFYLSACQEYYLDI